MTRPEHIRCRECQTLNDPGSIFCARCGSTLRRQGQAASPYIPRQSGPGRIFLRFILALVLLAVVVGIALVVLHSTKSGQGLAADSSPVGTMASTSTTLGSGSSPETNAAAPGDATLATASLSQIRPESADASSSLTPTNTNNFTPQNLSDDNLQTVWSEGVDGTGLGEWVRFDFGRPVQLARIEIANGNQKSKTMFATDPRVRSLRIEYSNGATQVVELLDTQDLQYVNPLQVSTDWIRLTIVSVYSDYTTADTSLSEVRFYELPAQL